jgi:hypothetical protein
VLGFLLLNLAVEINELGASLGRRSNLFLPIEFDDEVARLDAGAGADEVSDDERRRGLPGQARHEHALRARRLDRAGQPNRLERGGRGSTGRGRRRRARPVTRAQREEADRECDRPNSNTRI